MKLLQIIFFIYCTTLFSFEITIDKPSKKLQEKTLKRHIFKRDDLKEVVFDTNSRLVWQDNIEAKNVKKHLMEAKNYCYKLTLGGYNNWRLPSVEEFEMIADISLSNPAIDKAFKYTQPDFYITASPRLSDIDTIMYLDFKNGHRYEASRKGRGFVRCVRIGKKNSNKSFKVN